MTKISEYLFIGNSADGRCPDPAQIDAVLNVAVDLDTTEKFKERHKVGLIDGPGNPPNLFVAAVFVLYALVQEKKRILVYCHEGKSRSVMVVTSCLAIRNAEPFDVTLKRVMELRGVEDYKPSLYELGRRAMSTLNSFVI